jgi:hypothetical protein
MANRSDRHFPNLLGFKAVIGRWSDMEKIRGFPSWPGAIALLREAGYMTATGTNAIISSDLARRAGSIHESLGLDR